MGTAMTDEKKQIDSLLSEISDYSTSAEYARLFEFVAKAQTLGAYNSMLVYNQNPKATIVMEASKWKKLFGKGIKKGARKLVILFPFGPVHWVYDYADTYDLRGKMIPDEDELVAIYNSMFRPPHEVCPKYLENLLKVLPYYGVYVETDFPADPAYGGYIQWNPCFQIHLKIKNKEITRHSSYLIRVNSKATPAEQLMTLIHETAHLFLEHIPPAGDFEKPWKQRLPQRPTVGGFIDVSRMHTEEMEAEITKELVCSRLGIDDHKNAIRYLANHVNSFNKDEFSAEMVLATVDKIEKILQGKSKISEGLLFRQIRSLREMLKEESN